VWDWLRKKEKKKGKERGAGRNKNKHVSTPSPIKKEIHEKKHKKRSYSLVLIACPLAFVLLRVLLLFLCFLLGGERD